MQSGRRQRYVTGRGISTAVLVAASFLLVGMAPSSSHPDERSSAAGMVAAPTLGEVRAVAFVVGGLVVALVGGAVLLVLRERARGTDGGDPHGGGGRADIGPASHGPRRSP